ncbi:putative Endonuclease V [Hypsibius exemplaris]|uniref:Endonuclease V n=1 Tax=Hypsibius exemplaris TaxID=2072580 RepID=A0A1W0WH54_HYPEX|nr:putative Endonuclease V [Hypsibius exemplaris]
MPDPSNSDDLQEMRQEQNLLRQCISTCNTRLWQTTRQAASDLNSKEPEWAILRFIGGVDLSCHKDDQTKACAALVVLRLPDLEVVYKDFIVDDVTVPYIPGFLGAREYPLISRLLDRIRDKSPELFPQVLLVDGNGILHPRGCGSACYVGVKEKVPCIGVAKTFFHLPGWSDTFEDDLRKTLISHGDSADMVHDGRVVGKALIASKKSTNPVFVSVGHGIDLETAVWVVLLCSKYRVSEPVRQADQLSRQIINNLSKLPLGTLC